MQQDFFYDIKNLYLVLTILFSFATFFAESSDAERYFAILHSTSDSRLSSSVFSVKNPVNRLINHMVNAV